MFAILETGGKQYKVSEGDVIEVERIQKNKISNQNTVDFEDVLLIQDKDLHLGQPLVENGVIEAKILEEFKAPKIIVFKKKSKKGYRKTRGHRQVLHRIQIEKITIRKATQIQVEKRPPAPEEKAAVTKPAPKTATARTKPGGVKKSAAKPTKKTAAAPKTTKKTAAASKTTAAGKTPAAAKKTTTPKKKEK